MKLVAYPITIVYYFCFGLALVIFHPIQWFCFNVLGYKAHKTSVDVLQFFLMRCYNILGTNFKFTNPHEIPTTQPVILVANHQSMADIPPLIWYFRKHHVKFVSKKALGKGIPSVSFNLRHGGSVLIDRKNPLESIKRIETFAERVTKNNWAAVIFPEGTRSRTGVPKAFKTKGLATLLTHIPNATVVPVTINNSWKTLRYGKFPMGLGAKITFKVQQPINLQDVTDTASMLLDIENRIKNDVLV